MRKNKVREEIKLSDHFTYERLLKFTMPSIAMLVFTSIYGMVDGFFVSNFVGKTSFAAVNFIYPFLMMLGSLGFMFGAGGSAADEYLLLADFQSYCEAEERMVKTYADAEQWNRMSLHNIARSGIFAADRSIADYAERIWNVPYKK